MKKNTLNVNLLNEAKVLAEDLNIEDNYCWLASEWTDETLIDLIISLRSKLED